MSRDSVAALFPPGREAECESAERLAYVAQSLRRLRFIHTASLNNNSSIYRNFADEILWICKLSFSSPGSAFSFNGEPQAQAKYGNDACGLPLND